MNSRSVDEVAVDAVGLYLCTDIVHMTNKAVAELCSIVQFVHKLLIASFSFCADQSAKLSVG